MAGTPTPNFGLPQYDDSDTSALDTLLNGVTSTLDTTLQTALTNQNNYRLGTNAERVAVTGGALREGLKFYCTDTNFEWIYDGAAWVAISSPWIAFTPSWTAGSIAPSVGNGTLNAQYRHVGYKQVAVRYFLNFGSTTSGGAGPWSLSLPSGITAVASLGEQTLVCKTYLAGLGHVYSGASTIAAGGSSTTPHFPASASASNLAPAQNANASGGAGSGVPVHAGNYSYASGSNVVIQGILQVA